MASSHRFQPGDQIEYARRDHAPAGGWVAGTFQAYVPWPPGHAGGAEDMTAIVIPAGCSPAGAVTVPIGDLRFPPPAPGAVTEQPPPGEAGDVMPVVVNGMLVMSAFRILPCDGSKVYTWRVILRDPENKQEGQPAAGPACTVTRACWTADEGGWQDLDADGNEGFRGLSWTIAARTFARMIALDAMPRDDD